MKKQVQNFNKSDLAIHLSRKFSSLSDETIIEGIDLMLQEIINTVALDNVIGIANFKNIEYTNEKELYPFKQFLIFSTLNDGVRQVRIDSEDIIKGRKN